MKHFIRGFFKLVFKLIALPFIVALSVGVPFLIFIFSMSEAVCSIFAVIIAAGGIGIWATGTGTAFQGIVLIVMGFLLSPLGLHAVADWFIELLGDLNCSLKDFVTS
jgi:multisubunit Na+/H+ antiporter MnhG subunit